MRTACDILPFTRDKPWDVTSTLQSPRLGDCELAAPLCNRPNSMALEKWSRSLTQADDAEMVSSAQGKGLLRSGLGAPLSNVTSSYTEVL